MFWTIVFAGISVLCQVLVSWIGTIMNDLSPSKKKAVHIFFFGLTLLGVASVCALTYLAGRTERAHFAVVPNGKIILQSGKPLAVRVDFKDVGTGPSINTDTYSRAFIEDDSTKVNADDAIARFKPFFASHDIGSNLIAKDQEGNFMTAFGALLSPEDINNLLNNIKVLYVVGEINFKDDFGKHTQYICKSLQRPVSPNTLIWGTCGKSDDEVDKWWWQ
jgi:hypothetical protein